MPEIDECDFIYDAAKNLNTLDPLITLKFLARSGERSLCVYKTTTNRFSAFSPAACIYAWNKLLCIALMPTDNGASESEHSGVIAGVPWGP